MSALVRDGLEILMVVAVAGATWSAIVRWRAGHIAVPRCDSCGRPRSRAYESCPRCGGET